MAQVRRALVGISVLFVGKLVLPFRDELLIPIPDVTALAARLPMVHLDREAPDSDSDTTTAQGDSDATEH